MKQLLECSCGDFKAEANANLTAQTEPFVIPSTGWDEINDVIVVSFKLIPASMICGLNAVSNRRTWIADTYTVFLVPLRPAIIKGYLPQPYFDYFVQLWEIAKKLLGLGINEA